MFKKIMVPVDLDQAEALERALKVAADLARLHDAAVHYVGVAAAAPGASAHNPQEFGAKLERFAAEQAERHGIRASADAVASHDPSIDLDNKLLDEAGRIDADLIVMATHIPGFRDHFFASHGGQVASGASISVFLVR